MYPAGTDGWNAMGGAKNPFFLLSIPKNYKKVRANCNVQMATRALEVGMRVKYKVLKFQKLVGVNATYTQW